MDAQRYGFTSDTKHVRYEFTSLGEKGPIRKVVIFQSTPNRRDIYNLAYGDYNEQTKTIDDLTVSDNRDTELVLSTVAAIVLDFSHHHPGATIIAVGSTDSRTRLYQMAINKHYSNIAPLFVVEGYDKIRGWIPFEKGIQFEAFSAGRKNV